MTFKKSIQQASRLLKAAATDLKKNPRPLTKEEVRRLREMSEQVRQLRDALIVSAVLSGQKQGEIAKQFGITAPRVSQIYNAHLKSKKRPKKT